MSPGPIRRTPDEWCEIKRIRVVDRTGWATLSGGSTPKPWGDPITETEFDVRANASTTEPVADGVR